MSFLYEILSIVIGRWILGNIGFYVKRGYYFITRTSEKIKKKSAQSDFDDIIDVDEFSNRIIGLLTLFLAFVIADILF